VLLDEINNLKSKEMLGYDKPWLPGMAKHCGVSKVSSESTPSGSSGFFTAMCSGL
jgi:hypothetical protein